jgi:hypothetical protein
MAIDTSAWGGIQLDDPSPPPEDFEGLDVDDAAELIVEWFHRNFERPEESTPRDEGDWVYIWGGPYEHRDIIGDLLSDVAPEPVIEAAIEILDREETEWVPNSIRVQPPEDNDDVSIGDDSAEAAHTEMLRRISDLERALDQATRPGIGHNHPEDSLDDLEPLTRDDRREITNIIVVLKEQPVEPEPVPAELEKAPEVLESKSAKIMAYLSAKGDAFLQRAVEAAGAELGKWATRGALWAILGSALVAAANAITNWLHWVNPPF